MTENQSTPNSEENQNLEIPGKKESYWSRKFALINAILLLLALVAGYLEYVAYPALMTSPPPPSGYGFGETNVVLTLSWLTYQFSATNPNCLTPGCVLKGIPAFDLCQGLIYLVVLINLVHLIRVWTK